MAVEAKRGCGYRKVGGLYLVSGGLGAPCCRLPYPLTVCPCCGTGIKQARGWTWINPIKLFPALQVGLGCHACPLGAVEQRIGDKAGLLWIGASFYPTAQHFEHECRTQGLSRRIGRVPRGFKVGETWIFLGHPKACRIDNEEQAGIFRVFRPERIEKIITTSQSLDEEVMAKLAEQGITPVVVPDDDPDHRGSVYDKEEEEDE